MAQSHADIAVIVHPQNPHALTKQDVARIFLGKQKSYSDGSRVIPLDMPTSSPLYDNFARAVLRRHSQQVRAYWAQQLFTGKGTPPRTLGNAAAIKSMVAANPACIGYIDSADADASVRILFELQDPPPL
jgi:ABC-type phosphate transport system substrate-binding protein